MIYKILKTIYYGPTYIFELIYNKVLLKFYNVSIGKNSFIRGRLFIRNHGSITIGNDFTANCCLSANPVGGPYKTALVVGNGASLEIGSHVGISGTTIVCNQHIVIGDNVLIGTGCIIYDTDFHSLKYEDRMQDKDTSFKNLPVYIGEGVFIGARVIILKGVSIGKHSVIGAGSVIAKSVPENEVWAGNPAKKIR